MINERLAPLKEGQTGTFCIVDLDNFKLINDNNGNDCGDRALMFFARRLRSTCRFGDIIGRRGGDGVGFQGGGAAAGAAGAGTVLAAATAVVLGDGIRAGLQQKGIVLEDRKDGTTWSVV